MKNVDFLKISLLKFTDFKMCSKEGQWIIVYKIFHLQIFLFFVYTAFRYQLLFKNVFFYGMTSQLG